MSETTTRATWSKEQIRNFAAGFKAQWGDAMKWSVPAVRDALVGNYVLGIIIQLDRKDIRVEDVDVLRAQLLYELRCGPWQYRGDDEQPRSI
jgi:hypothetical protein